MKAYVTKYALTAGIQEVDGELFADGRAIKWGSYFNSAHGEGVEWHRTREGAVEKAHEMRTKKIASLRKSIAKLERMTW